RRVADVDAVVVVAPARERPVVVYVVAEDLRAEPVGLDARAAVRVARGGREDAVHVVAEDAVGDAERAETHGRDAACDLEADDVDVIAVVVPAVRRRAGYERRAPSRVGEVDDPARLRPRRAAVDRALVA